MAQYLAELYLSRTGPACEGPTAAVRIAAEQLVAEGIPLRFLRLIFVPEDETLFLLYDAPSAAAVEEAVTRAGLQCDRVLEAQSRP